MKKLKTNNRSNVETQANPQHLLVMENNNFQKKPKVYVDQEVLTVTEIVNASQTDEHVTNFEEAPREGGTQVRFIANKDFCVLSLCGLMVVGMVVVYATTACNDCLTQKKGGAA